MTTAPDQTRIIASTYHDEPMPRLAAHDLLRILDSVGADAPHAIHHAVPFRGGYLLVGKSHYRDIVDALPWVVELLGLRIVQIADLATSREPVHTETVHAPPDRGDHHRDEFIAMASHQLRTPLTSIKGYLSMVLDGDMGDVPEKQRHPLAEAYASSQRMAYLINDFLDMSRLRDGRFALTRRDTDLARVLSEEIDQLRATAAARGVTLQYDPPTSLPVAAVDETKLRQVMMNMIDNAIYYSKPNTAVRITLHHDAHRHITFRVRDHGIGVPRADQPHLFTKFYRATNAQKARPDGTGIGLFMARKIIIAHHGSMIFTSTPGRGSTFGFRIPV